jgi:hypothetical protein
LIGSRDVGMRVRQVASEGSLALLVAVIRTASDEPSDWLEGRSLRRIAVGRMVVAFTSAHAGS